MIETLLNRLSAELSHAPKERRLLLASIVYFLMFLLACSVVFIGYVLFLIFSEKDFAIDDVVSRQHGKLVFFEPAGSVRAPLPSSVDDYVSAIGAVTDNAIRITDFVQLDDCKKEVSALLKALRYDHIDDKPPTSVFGYFTTPAGFAVRGSGRCLAIGGGHAIFFSTVSPDPAAVGRALEDLYSLYDQRHPGNENNTSNQQLVGFWRDVGIRPYHRLAAFDSADDCKAKIQKTLDKAGASVFEVQTNYIGFHDGRSSGWVGCIPSGSGVYILPIFAFGFDDSSNTKTRDKVRDALNEEIGASAPGLVGSWKEFSTRYGYRMAYADDSAYCLQTYRDVVTSQGGSEKYDYGNSVQFDYKTSTVIGGCYPIADGKYFMYHEAIGFDDASNVKIRNLLNDRLKENFDSVDPSSVSLATKQQTISAGSLSDCTTKIRDALREGGYEIIQGRDGKLVGRRGAYQIVEFQCQDVGQSDSFGLVVTAAAYDNEEGASWSADQLIEALQ